MCELFTIAGTTITVMEALGAAGTVLGAMSAMQTGQAGAGAANYNAQVAENNRIIAEQQAADARKRGEIAEAEQRRKTVNIKGSQKASIGASGVALDSGSPLDILGDTAAFGELDALTIRNNAEREAYGYQVQGMNFGAEAGLLRNRAKVSEQSGWMNAGTTLLSGAAGVGDRWYARNKGGGGGSSLASYGAFGRTAGGPR